jgi:hypothetical protein
MSFDKMAMPIRQDANKQNDNRQSGIKQTVNGHILIRLNDHSQNDTSQNVNRQNVKRQNVKQKNVNRQNVNRQNVNRQNVN